MKGTIIFFNYQKGFGFIAGEDGKSYFFGRGHYLIKLSGIRKALKQKATLQFDVLENEKGPIATNIDFVTE